jgi:hypothetical protein
MNLRPSVMVVVCEQSRGGGVPGPKSVMGPRLMQVLTCAAKVEFCEYRRV